MSNIKYELLRELETKINLGTSKTAERDKNGGVSSYIHSGATARTYMQQVAAYGLYLREIGQNKCSIEESKQFAAAWVQSKNSAWSQNVARSALAKVYGCSAAEICSVEKREKGNIHKGREFTDRAAAIDKNHSDLVAFCKATGLRNNRELSQITRANFVINNQEISLNLKGKGGRERTINILQEDREIVIKFIDKYLQNDKDHIKVPHGMNVHKYRADFAEKVYSYAIKNGITNGETYKPHKDGRIFDKKALDYVNSQLGHGTGRQYTAVTNYLYKK